MLCIKTGMQNEYEIAKKYAAPGTLVLTGIQTLADLRERVPDTVKAILSFGMSGGLRPELPIVGQTIIASYLIGPTGATLLSNRLWVDRLYAKTKYFVQPYYSSGVFNEANTPAQRAALFHTTGAWCIDDESLFVAQFAIERHIPFAIVRNVSDAWRDNVSITSNILNANGSANPMAVIKDLFTDPQDMIKIGVHYEISQRGLEAAAQQLGPNFCWES